MTKKKTTGTMYLVKCTSAFIFIETGPVVFAHAPAYTDMFLIVKYNKVVEFKIGTFPASIITSTYRMYPEVIKEICSLYLITGTATLPVALENGRY